MKICKIIDRYCEPIQDSHSKFVGPQFSNIRSKRATRRGNSDWGYLPLSSFDSGPDVLISWWNIDNHTGMNPQGPIVTTIPYLNSASNYNIFNSIIKTLDLAYRASLCHCAEKIESENLGGNKNLENAELENSFEAEKVGCKKSVI